jgi:protein TonB
VSLPSRRPAGIDRVAAPISAKPFAERPAPPVLSAKTFTPFSFQPSSRDPEYLPTGTATPIQLSGPAPAATAPTYMKDRSGKGIAAAPLTGRAFSGLQTAGVPSVAPHGLSEASRVSPQTIGEPVGPVSDRGVLHRVLPEYPAWAEERGVTGIVQLYFTVTNAGEVHPNVRVEQTSGYPDLDRVAVEALKKWRFSSLPASNETRQWGRITFSFSISR